MTYEQAKRYFYLKRVFAKVRNKKGELETKEVDTSRVPEDARGKISIYNNRDVLFLASITTAELVFVLDEGEELL